jgi:hypothetical protein
MQTRLRIGVGIWFGSLLIVAGVQATAPAEQIIFAIDKAVSSVSVSHTDSVLGTAVPQSSGSATSPIEGHFVVEFDPFSGDPSTIQFVFGHGFLAYTDTIADASPGTLGNPSGTAPANLAIEIPGSSVKGALRNTTWDWKSGPIAKSGGVFDATQTSFFLLSGSIDDVNDHGVFDHDDITGNPSDPGDFLPLTSGSWSLVESAPGSGFWTLTGDVAYEETDITNHGDHTLATTTTYGGPFVATAQFGAGNVDAVGAGETSGSVLGGAGTTGGVDVSFDQVTTAGTLSVQEIPTTGLSYDALQALELETNFQLAGLTPQIWDVSFGGQFTGPLTLTFGYDESLLGGVPEANLFMWHFDDALNDWEQIFGSIDVDLNTITISTDSLSPFALGVPEPRSFVLAGLGSGLLLVAAWRRRRAATSASTLGRPKKVQ